jgi:predicted DNA-binding protein with PD1-like motif
MEVFPGGAVAEVLALRLDRGEDVLASLETLAKERDIHTGIVLSGVGTLDRARLHHITNTGDRAEHVFAEYEGPIELVSIEGIIADRVPHLHACIAIRDTTYMGHLEPGCRVLRLAEIAVARVNGLSLCRRVNPDTGISLLGLAD